VFTFIFLICQFAALTARQLAHGLLGLFILWMSWHAFIAHERGVHGVSFTGHSTAHIMRASQSHMTGGHEDSAR
jgi:hypothetical protein